MKRFFRTIFVLLLIVLSCISIIEFFYKDYKPPIELKFDNYYRQHNTQVILLGNSHVGSLGTPTFDNKKSFNFSVGGQDIFHFYAILKTILEKKNSIKLIILGVDYDLLGYDYRIANTMWLDRNYYKNTKMLYDSSSTNKIIASSHFFQSNRDFSYLTIEKSIISNNTKNNEHLNFNPVEGGNPKNRAIEHSFHKFDTILVETNTMYLQELIYLVKKKKINLILVNLPKKNEYYKHYNKKALKVGKKQLKMLANSNQLIFFDFWGSNFFSYEDFNDGDHLSNLGAQKVISILEYSINNEQSHN